MIFVALFTGLDAAALRLGVSAARRLGGVARCSTGPRRLGASAPRRRGAAARFRASAPPRPRSVPLRAPPCPSVPLRAPPCLRAYLRLRIPLCLCAPPRHSESLRASAPPHAHVNALRPRRPPGSARRAGSAAHMNNAAHCSRTLCGPPAAGIAFRNFSKDLGSSTMRFFSF